MQIKNKKPPFYFLIRLRFPKATMEKTVFTFGKTVYTMDPMSKHLNVHEAIHIKQQKNFIGGMWWWTKYMISKKFRLDQELEAYRAQYNYVASTCTTTKTKIFLSHIAGDLSGGLYGKGISFVAAKHWIKQDSMNGRHAE